jgi:hypothetical protein
MQNLTTRTMNILLGLSACIIIVGAIFEIQHYPYGRFILKTGFILSIVVSAREIQRLRQILKKNGYKD